MSARSPVWALSVVVVVLGGGVCGPKVSVFPVVVMVVGEKW